MFSADLGVNQVASTPPATDPPFQKVALLLHGDGTNGAQNNTFLDSSTNNFTITRTGNVAQGTFSPFSLADGYWSNYFNNSSYLQFTNGSFSNLGTNDWTVEFWIYPQGTLSGSIFTNSNTATGFDFAINPSPNNRIRFTIDGGNTKQMDAYGVNNNVWTHFAMTRSGNNLYMYVNGTRVTTSTTTASISNSATYGYVGYGYNSYSSNTYVSNLRLVNGTALYTGASFTVPTSPLTAVTNTAFLSCQSNRFKDNSSNNVALTATGTPRVTAFSPFTPSAAYSASTNGGSGYFDGSGDYLSVPSSSAFAYGTGDFTWEVWIYPTASNWASGNFYFLDHGSNGGVLSYNSNQVSFYDGPNTFNTGAVVKPYTWSHVAVTRSSATLRVFVNGVTYTYGTSDTVNFGNNSVTVGDYGGHGYSMFGYMADVRIVKGTALYTSNFTPPTAPLTAISGTSLLLNCTNAGIFDNAGKNDIETVGNAQISTSVKKYGTGSMAFDGTGDWLYLADRPELQLGTGNFTIEGWLYLNATGAARGIIGKGTSTTGWLLSTDSSNKVVFTYGSSTITSTGTLSGSTWYHIAVCREGTGTNQTKIYINGSNNGTGTVSTDFNQTNVMYVGADRTGGSAMNGYIDDLRITKGQALYTSNFTPPTQAFPNV